MLYGTRQSACRRFFPFPPASGQTTPPVIFTHGASAHFTSQGRTSFFVADFNPSCCDYVILTSSMCGIFLEHLLSLTNLQNSHHFSDKHLQTFLACLVKLPTPVGGLAATWWDGFSLADQHLPSCEWDLSYYGLAPAMV